MSPPSAADNAPGQTDEPQPDAATTTSVEAFNTTTVELAGISRAGDVTDIVGSRHFLHAGPPIDVADVTGPMRGALIGGLLFEGDAQNEHDAAAIIDSGELTISPCHDAGALGAMAGVITPNMPVVVAASGDRRTFSPLNEGTGGAVRYGSFDTATIDRLRWIAAVMAPALDAAIQ